MSDRSSRFSNSLWDRSKIISHNLFAKVLKTLDILQTECDSNVFPFHKWETLD